MNEPRRGDGRPRYGSEGTPCLVISTGATDQDRALATLVPHTTSARNSRFEVKVKVSFLREGVFDAQSLVTIPHAKVRSQTRKPSSGAACRGRASRCTMAGIRN